MKTNNIFKLLISLTFFTILAGCNFPTNTNTNSSSSSTTTATVDSFVGTWRYSYTSNNLNWFTDYTYNSDGTGIMFDEMSKASAGFLIQNITWELLPNNTIKISKLDSNGITQSTGTFSYSFRSSTELCLGDSSIQMTQTKLNYSENDLYGSWSFSKNNITYVTNFQNNKTGTSVNNSSNNTPFSFTWDFLPSSKIQVISSYNGQQEQKTYFYRIINSKLFLYEIKDAIRAILSDEFTKA